MNEEEPEQLQNIVNVQNVYPIWVTNQIRTVSRQFLHPPYKIVPHPIFSQLKSFVSIIDNLQQVF